MSNYKYPTPQLLLKAICNAIRAKTGSNDKIAHQDIPDELDSIIAKEEECEIAARELSNIIYGSEIKVLDSKYIPYIARYKFYGSDLTTIDLPECTSIGEQAFDSCTSLTIENLPECTSIGSNTFRGCTNLTTIDLPKCTSINYSAFRECNNLTTINLPKCTYIGNGPGLDEYHAFYDCSNLTTVIFGDAFSSSIPSVFCNTPIEDGTGYIYVPDNALNEYRSNNPNYQFKPISELPSNLKEEYGYE